MKNKDIMEWMLDEGIDPLTTVTTEKGEMYLSDILTKHLTEQLRIQDVSSLLKAEREATKEDIREWLIAEDFKGLAKRL